ncbi:hypothetical protein QE418_001474 [Microbacterium testaceum]|uniref:hypothetical protein n=1 Tax=Microbacterium testaceum TaxID=2033 RepID=UPI0027893AEB|nr:hypothetical protein [Microbacterium testaceum]MDQ1112026.1 hypothetical protein [Microbacterium testaceum]
MAYFIALGILSLAGIVGTVWLVRTDGYGRVPTDPRRVDPREPRAARGEAPQEPRAAKNQAPLETLRVAAPETRHAATGPAVAPTP